MNFTSSFDLIKKLQTALAYLDRPQRQVMIEARLVYATDIFQRNLGLKWGAHLPAESQRYLNILGSTYSRSFHLSGLNLFPNPGGFSLAGLAPRSASGLTVGSEKSARLPQSPPRRYRRRHGPARLTAKARARGPSGRNPGSNNRTRSVPTAERSRSTGRPPAASAPQAAGHHKRPAPTPEPAGGSPASSSSFFPTRSAPAAP